MSGQIDVLEEAAFTAFRPWLLDRFAAYLVDKQIQDERRVHDSAAHRGHWGSRGGHWADGKQTPPPFDELARRAILWGQIADPILDQVGRERLTITERARFRSRCAYMAAAYRFKAVVADLDPTDPTHEPSWQAAANAFQRVLDEHAWALDVAITHKDAA